MLTRDETNISWMLQLFQSDKTNGLCRINPVTKTGQRLYMVRSDLINYYECLPFLYSLTCFLLLPGTHLHCPPPRCTCCSCPSCRSLPWLCRTPPHSAPSSPTRWCRMQWYVLHEEISWIILQLSCKASGFDHFLQAKSLPCGLWWLCICCSERLKELEPKWTQPLFWRSSSPTCKGSDLRWFKIFFLFLR